MHCFCSSPHKVRSLGPDISLLHSQANDRHSEFVFDYDPSVNDLLLFKDDSDSVVDVLVHSLNPLAKCFLPNFGNLVESLGNNSYMNPNAINSISTPQQENSQNCIHNIIHKSFVMGDSLNSDSACFIYESIQEGQDISQDCIPTYDFCDTTSVLDVTPCVFERDTPNISVESTEIDSGSELSESLSADSLDAEVSFLNNTNTESANDVLKKLRIKNTNRVIIGTLNINSVAPKLEQLREVIENNLDVLTIQETKLDDSFPTAQLLIEGYSEPYRLD